MSAVFERWKRSYNSKLSYYGVPENEHTDKMARLYFTWGYSAMHAAYDTMEEYIAEKRALRQENKAAHAPATVPVEVTERATQEENTR